MPTPHDRQPIHWGSFCIAIVGMNGIGKSSFGKSLASALGMHRIDTDTEFRKLHGKEQDYIDQHGWDAFRKTEEEIVCRSLLPDHVVVLSGGAVESLSVRSALKEKAIVLWIQAGKNRAHTQLTKAKLTRPEFKEGLTKQGVKNILEARNPFYEEVADVALFPHLKFKEQLPMALTLLEKFVAKNQ